MMNLYKRRKKEKFEFIIRVFIVSSKTNQNTSKVFNYLTKRILKANERKKERVKI